MATFLVYEKAVQTAHAVVDRESLSTAGVTGVNLGAGLVAGLAAAVVSQPADTILSKINKDRGPAGEGTTRRIVRIATELGPRGAFTGMRARLVMVGAMTAVQFGIYGNVKKVCVHLIICLGTIPCVHEPANKFCSQLFGATDGVELK